MSDNQQVGIEELEKSFNAALETLSGILNTKVEDLQKAKKDEMDAPKSSADISGEKEDDEEDKKEDEKEEVKGEMKKSVESVVEADPEAKQALDVEPYLRNLVKGIDEKFEEISKSIENLKKGMESNENLFKSQSEVLLKFGELQKANSNLQKSIQEEVKKIGDTPIPSGTVLKKSGDKFETPVEELGTKEQILEKSMQLCKEGKISIVEATKIEGRLNKGIALEAKHIELIKGVK